MAVAVLAQQRIDEVAVAVDGAVEIAPAASDLHVGFVEIPGDTPTATAFFPQPSGEERSEAAFPLADRLVRDAEAADEEEFGDITQAELVAEAPEDGVERCRWDTGDR